MGADLAGVFGTNVPIWSTEAPQAAGSVPAMATGTCESCGSEEDVTEVRRVYVTPEDWDTEGKAEPQPGTERWCYACRAHYPHQEV